MDLGDKSSGRTLDFDSDFVGLNVGYSLVEVDPLSFLLVIMYLLLTSSAIVPSLIESAKKGNGMVLPKYYYYYSQRCSEHDSSMEII